MGISDGLKDAWKKSAWAFALVVIAVLVAGWWLLTQTDILEWLGQNWPMILLLGILLYVMYSLGGKVAPPKQDLGLVLKDLCEQSELFQRKGILYREIDRNSVGGDMMGEYAVVWFDFPGTASRVWAQAQFTGGRWLATAFDDGLISSQERRKRIRMEPSVEEMQEQIQKQKVVSQLMEGEG